jgi:hypothetical protein
MQPSANFKHDMDTKLSSCGKIVCFKNAGAICSTIASILEIETRNNSKLQHVVAMISSNSVSAEMDLNYLRSDIMYQQKLRQHFGFEMTKLMNRKTSRITLNEYIVSFLLKTFIEAVLDANALNIFATSNLKIMADIGGKKVKKERKNSPKDLSLLLKKHLMMKLTLIMILKCSCYIDLKANQDYSLQNICGYLLIT